MASIDILAAFIVTTAAFAFIPGPAMLYAAARTVAGGRRSGLMAALGLHLGGYAHVTAAAAGLSVLLHAVPSLYLAVRLAGAAYLIWLGVSLFRPGPAGDVDPSRIAPTSGRQAFLGSVAVEVLNPKTAIFFLAFLPQFVDVQAAFPVWVQLVLLGTVVNAMFSLADLVCVACAGLVVDRLKRSSAARRMLQRAGGTVLVGLGAHLMLQRR